MRLAFSSLRKERQEDLRFETYNSSVVVGSSERAASYLAAT